MSKKTLYLTTIEALTIHAIGIARYGGSDGVRDMGALESALFRPQSGYYKDIIEEAAALLESVAVNHPFQDGNKRAAFGITDTFLRVNGFEIDTTSKKAISKFDELFGSNSFNFAHLEPWLRSIVK